MFTTIRPQSSSVTTTASEKLSSGSFDPYFRLVEMFHECFFILDRGTIEMDWVIDHLPLPQVTILP